MLCAVLISVNFCSSLLNGELGATDGSDLIPS